MNIKQTGLLNKILTKLFLVNTVLRNVYGHIYKIDFGEHLRIGKKITIANEQFTGK